MKKKAKGGIKKENRPRKGEGMKEWSTGGGEGIEGRKENTHHRYTAMCHKYTAICAYLFLKRILHCLRVRGGL